jgi:hypothetical protein
MGQGVGRATTELADPTTHSAHALNALSAYEPAVHGQQVPTSVARVAAEKVPAPQLTQVEARVCVA